MIVDALRSIKVFQAVAMARSFTAAAEQMSITPAMATRYVKNIENQIGVRLLNRTSRNVSLTEAGEIYLARVMPLLEGLDEAVAVVTETTVEPRGILKVKMPAMMSTPYFSKLIAEFCATYPEVKLHFDISWQTNNIVEEGYDLALHVGEVNADGLVARKMADVRSFLVATPTLLNRLGRISDIHQLKHIPFLAHLRITNNNKVRWKQGDKTMEFETDVVLRSENEMMILHTALESVGATILPEWLVGPHVNQGRLETILSELVVPTVPLYALYPDRNYLPAKTRSFIDFMAAFKADGVNQYRIH
jgi:DNA-binding transcriptional LysR family regulator